MADPLSKYTTPIGFADSYTDAETGYLYLIHRYYDPTTGQFLSIDPLVNQTQQPYQYAGGDPVNNTDPSGQSWCDILPAGCGVLPGGGRGTVPDNQGFTKFSLVDYGHNQCSGGFACGYVWNPVVHYYDSLPSAQVTSNHAIGHLVGMLTGLYSESPNPSYASYCQAGPQSCVSNVLIPGIDSATSAQGLFQLSNDNSLVWWSIQVGPGRVLQLADAIEFADNLIVPFLSSDTGWCPPSQSSMQV